MTNTIALGFYTLSFIQRGRGGGKVLAFAGLGVASAGAFLGGHLAYRQVVGANHTEDVPHLFPVGWHPLGSLADLPEGELHRVGSRGSTPPSLCAATMPCTCSPTPAGTSRRRLMRAPSSARAPTTPVWNAPGTRARSRCVLAMWCMARPHRRSLASRPAPWTGSCR